ncbi:MAG: PIG-L family deacetylase, partial [Pyrinomonadaceae bacterium]|nr:PIG-L family deacetylase [Pyrinomonadaceae bacterium]
MNRHPLSYPRALAAIFLFALFFILPSSTAAQPPPAVMNAAETEQALKKLTVLGSALYVAAHPDDENTSMLAYLSGERLVRAAYLSVTRGDGGQNLIGTEQGALLGVVRTQELLAARRIDGAEQFFTRAIDFGFSKSPEEALRIWGHDAVLADVVWVVRRFRPDVIITRFPSTGEGGHGHHTASAILAAEAFAAAGDASRFPEQLKHVRPWQPKRLLWNSFFRRGTGGGGGQLAAEGSGLLSVDLGAYNPLLGKSYTEIAANSRSMHKSQGFGSAERRGTAINTLQHLAGDAPARDIFDGVDLSWRRVPGGEAVGRILEEANRAYRPANAQATLPLLVRAHAAMSKLPADDPWVAGKRRKLLEVIRACAGLWVEAVSTEAATTPGGKVRVTMTLVNRSDYPFRVESIMPPFGASPQTVNADLKNNQPLSTPLTVRVPAGAVVSQPYWLRSAPSKGTYAVTDQQVIGMPE